jgi:hypothetical protein
MLHLLENPVGRSEARIVSVWPAEHHFSEYGYCVSAALMLAALVAVTKRIRLGTGAARPRRSRDRLRCGGGFPERSGSSAAFHGLDAAPGTPRRLPRPRPPSILGPGAAP